MNVMKSGVEPEVVILMPFLEDRKSLNQLLKNLCIHLPTFHLVVVDDGSLVDSVDTDFLKNYLNNWTHIVLKRNTGAQRALAVGLNYIHHNFQFKQLLIMDSDGEDSSESAAKLLKFHSNLSPNQHICVATRQSREDSLMFKILYFLYKSFFWLCTGKRMNFGHLSVLTKEAVSRIINYPQLWIHIGSTYLLSRIPMTSLPLSRDKRYFGKSKINLTLLLNHGLRSVVAQSELVIPRIFMFGIFQFSVLSCLLLLGFVTNKDLFLLLAGLVLLLTLVLFSTITLIMLLGVSRNSGEYDSTNFKSLINHVSHTISK